MTEGTIVRISGPICHAVGLEGCGLYEVVEVGEKRLVGEIIKLQDKKAVIQVYEENTGLRIGEPAFRTGRPLSVQLGPGLVGRIYDGIQRPLPDLFETEGPFLQPGVKCEPLSNAELWDYVPVSQAPEEILPGQLLGTVRETPLVEHRLFAPYGLKGRRWKTLAGPGRYSCRTIIGVTDRDEEVYLAHFWPVRSPRPYLRKETVSRPLVTGQRVIDVLFPLARGGAACLPGGFGTGKTMIQQAVAKWCEADLIVYIGCGERGNEMTDVLEEFPRLVDPRTNRPLMERTILIANTSNMPVSAREVSIYTGVTLAEYYRDMGYDVAILADSTSRWAEALRELSGRLEEMPAEEGFPSYLPTRLAEFYERAGVVRTGEGREGSISIIGAVSPPGGDFSEPVTQHTKRFVRCFWALDRDLANARHYPAVGWIESYSDYVPDVRDWWNSIDPAWENLRQAALDVLKNEQKLQEIVRLIGPDSLPQEQRLILLTAEMIKNGFLQQNSFDAVDRFCVPRRQIGILALIVQFHRRGISFLQKGGRLDLLANLPSREKLVRAKSDVPNGQEDKLTQMEISLREEFDVLEGEIAPGKAS